MFERCVICEARIWFWNEKRYFKYPPILNPSEFDEGWCHKECEDLHLTYLVRYYLQPEKHPAYQLYCQPATNLGALSGYAPCEPIYTVAINSRLIEYFTEEEIQMIVKYWGEKWSLDGNA